MPGEEVTIYRFIVEGKAQALRDFAEIEAAKNRAAGDAGSGAARAARGGGGGSPAGALPGGGDIAPLGTAGAGIDPGMAGMSGLERIVERRMARVLARIEKAAVNAAGRAFSGVGAVGGPGGGIVHGGGTSGLPFAEMGGAGGGIPHGGRVAGARPGQPYEIARLGLGDLTLNPEKTQWRSETNRSGVTNTLQGGKFDPKLAGFIDVFPTPGNPGGYTVFNAHHRVRMAEASLAEGSISPSDAQFTARVHTGIKTYEEARLTGARLNIAEGSGSPRDIADYMRQTGDYDFAPNIKGVRQGTALSRLSEPVYQAYRGYNLSEEKALSIAQLEGSDAQNQVFQRIRDEESKRGKALSKEVVENYVKQILAGSTVSAVNAAQTNLFGAMEAGPSTINVGFERSDLVTAVEAELRGAGKIFKGVTGTKGRGTSVMTAAGVEIPAELVDRFRALGGETGTLLGQFSYQSNLSGSPISKLLNQGAEAMQGGAPMAAVVDNLVKEILGRSDELLASAKTFGGGAEAFDIGEIAGGAPAAPIATPAAGGGGGKGGGRRRRTATAGVPEPDDGLTPEERQARANEQQAREFHQWNVNQGNTNLSYEEFQADRASRAALNASMQQERSQRWAEAERGYRASGGEPTMGGGVPSTAPKEEREAELRATYRNDPAARADLQALGYKFPEIDEELAAAGGGESGAAAQRAAKRRAQEDEAIEKALRVARGAEVARQTGEVVPRRSPRVDRNILQRGLNIAVGREDDDLSNELGLALDWATNRGLPGQSSRETLRERRQQAARSEEDTLLGIDSQAMFGDNTTARLATLTKQKSIATKRLVDATAKGFTDQIKVYQEAVDRINTEMAGIKNAGKSGFGAPQGGITGALQEAGFKAFPYTIGAFAIQSGGAPFAMMNQRWTTAYQQAGRFNPEDAQEQLRTMELEARLGEQGAGTRRWFSRQTNAFLGAVGGTGLAGPVAAAGDIGSAALSQGLNLAGLGMFARSIVAPAVRGAAGVAMRAGPAIIAGARAASLPVAAAATGYVAGEFADQFLRQDSQRMLADRERRAREGQQTPIERWLASQQANFSRAPRVQEPGRPLTADEFPVMSPSEQASRLAAYSTAQPGFRAFEEARQVEIGLQATAPTAYAFQQANLGQAQGQRAAALGARDLLNAERQEVVGSRRFGEDQQFARRALDRSFVRGEFDINLGRERRERDLFIRRDRQQRDIDRGEQDALTDIDTGLGRQVRSIDRQAGYSTESIGRNLGRSVRDIDINAGRSREEIQINAGRSREDVERNYGRGMEDLVLGQIGGLAGGFLSLGLNRSRALEDLERGTGNAMTDLERGVGYAKTDAARAAGDAVEEVGIGAGIAKREAGYAAGDARSDVSLGADRAGRDADTAFGDAWKDSTQAAQDALDDLTRAWNQQTSDLEEIQKRERERYDEDLKERQRLRADQLTELRLALELSKTQNQSLEAQKKIIDESVVNIGKANDAIKDIPAAVRNAIAAALST